MEQTTTAVSIVEQVKVYLETKIKVLKYEGIDKASAIIAEVFTDLIVIMLALVTFVFFTITLALFAGHLLGSDWEGFGCVTFLYIILLFSSRVFKVSMQNMFIRMFIEKVFKERNQRISN